MLLRSKREKKKGMEESEAIEILKNRLKKHPRWDPLRREPASESYEITLNDINFVITISDLGFAMYFIFNQEIELRSTDGKVLMHDSYGNQKDIIDQFMPNLNLNVQKINSTVFPYPHVVKHLVLDIPPTRFDVFLYDPNWIWNEFIPDILSYDGDEEGARLFNVWVTFGNNEDETHYPATNISLAKSKITFTAKVPKGFKNIQQCDFFIQGGNRNVVPFLTINPRGAEGVTNGNVWVISQAKAVLINDLEADTISVTVSQSAEVKTYILSVFQHYVYQNETSIKTMSLGEGKLRIFPLQFCTNLASAVNTTLKVIFRDDEERVRLNPIYGFELSGKPWGTNAMIRLPIVSLKRQIMIGFMTQLKDLEDIPMNQRTTAVWSEMERLIKIIKTSSEIMVIECVVCSNVATLRNEQTRKPYCSKKCAQKDFINKRL